jgi:preprotein translocase subunit SecE
MKTDKAFRAALAKNCGELPYGFEFRVMRKIQHEVERSENRRVVVESVTVVLVSVFLLTGIYVLLKTIFQIDVLQPFASIRFPSWNSMIGSAFADALSTCSVLLFILVTMIALLSLDSLFRRKMRKRHTKHE